jgi:DNA mismatch repair protein MutS
MSKSSADTPLMQQHKAIKQRYPDAVLLFRVGDFYETFGQDAIIASQVLGITLTKRNNGAAYSLELAGFPHHALDTYLHKLVKAGYRVAICDQLEDPKQAKGIVKRGVTEMVTPGTTTNEKLLEHHSNNFLGALYFAEQDQFGIAFLDISTGEFFLAQGDREYADKLLQSFQPAEVLFQRNRLKTFKENFGSRFYTYTLDEWIFQDTYAQETLLKHFQTHSLKGFGVEELPMGLIAAGSILHYLRDTEHPNLQHISSMQRIDRDDFLWMDRFTIRNLELLGAPNSEAHSLLKVLDHTVSPMGARLLKRWMVFPLKDLTRIQERLGLVEYFIARVDERNQTSHRIKLCGDVERLVSKIPLKKIGPRELIHLAKGLQQVKDIQEASLDAGNDYLRRLTNALNPCTYIAEKMLRQLMENPAPTTAKGNYIADGVHTELDELRSIASTGKEYLVKLQQEEAAKTGIPSLKIGFNNVFGYYLEVTNTHKNKVPDSWTRKQTLANAERYITPELKEYEEKITGAEDKILALEFSIFESLLNELQDFLAPIQTNGNILATLDCLICFANNAIQFGYKKPELSEQVDLYIEEGRHPVIERYLNPGDQYVSNTITLNKTEQQVIILTGPNMSGKSALLRQVALITLMAHMGSFVPATRASLPLTDKIFTRVGASDNLSGGESTFMVEMNETASILNNVTARSLILLDEIGRGTSTYDGISIAWSMVEHLHQIPEQPLTLFATHYHELNELENNLERVRNYHITNKEVGNKIIFLRKLAPGGSTHSFGIHVARMAGMPASLIRRANEILSQLETQSIQSAGKNTPMVVSLDEKVKEIGGPKMQLSIFDVHSQTFETIRSLLEGLDINRLTPVEALLKLQEIKNMIR